MAMLSAAAASVIDPARLAELRRQRDAAEQAQRDADATAAARIDAARCRGRQMAAESMPWAVLQRLAGIHAGAGSLQMPDGHCRRAAWQHADEPTRRVLGELTDPELEGFLAGVAEVAAAVVAHAGS
jgi:hypothetical protein